MNNGQLNVTKKGSFEMGKLCSECRIPMKYIYGEMYQCPSCGTKELSDFGKVREFLEKAGPQPAVIIADATGVKLSVIDNLLRQGRIEIPDGSDVYIKCQSCGADIRYGRYCPECIARTTNNISQAMLAPEMGERPRSKSGRMYTKESTSAFVGRKDKNKKDKKNVKQ